MSAEFSRRVDVDIIKDEPLTVDEFAAKMGDTDPSPTAGTPKPPTARSSPSASRTSMRPARSTRSNCSSATTPRSTGGRVTRSAAYGKTDRDHQAGDNA